MKALGLFSMSLMSAGILVSCHEEVSRTTVPPPAEANSKRDDDGGPPVMALIRSAEKDYRVFLEKHEAARNATKARRAVEEASPQAYLLGLREDEALAERAQAAEARNATWKTVQSYTGSPFERKQVAAYLRRYELREEIRLAALAAELYATDPERQEDLVTAERRMAAYREKLDKEEAAWEEVDKGGWREAVGAR
jgi:hypothetical protein